MTYEQDMFLNTLAYFVERDDSRLSTAYRVQDVIRELAEAV